ncbi:MBL fold metallo-hydrolase [Bacillus sp. FJAT-49736]|uniref:YtnP family quorum-quenching lactonase n=1 Tax=Bacillus sp. FJAT-49736 TaxID=2833582 RepID=UPI001BC8E16D|nr:MBL fold metallo-hydrolase [Bacillus sp. FJAT-49736]MBS4173861.1 MBL fold metallo-hydrolase [Bacillus sp. FJAT-49736]
MQTLTIGDITLKWLNGGITHLDGGAMFGVVPKALWSKKYPVNENNQIPLLTHPIFLQINGKNILIESGIGNGKLTEKQKRNFGVTEESKLEESLKDLGITPEDIDIICMTHLHFDHVCGLTKPKEDRYVSVFPNAIIYTSQIEWDEMKQPNIRSKSTYWKENWEAIESQVVPFQNEVLIEGALRMVHTGGHSDGHSIILIESNGEKAIHMADIMPTHAHQNPLWVMAYDDYPMTSIFAKEKWIKEAIQDGAWFIFYHDAIYRAIKWDEEGNLIDAVKCEL